MSQLITVSVPVYNAEKYLDKCILSIINQSYKNLDILLIDDGSKDKSLEICRKYVEIDKRVRVINKENEGLCVTRNLALDIMFGDFIMFIDCDDWVAETIVEFLYDKIRENNLDFAACSGYDINESDGSSVAKIRQGDKIFTGKEGIYDFYSNQKFTFDAIQCKLYAKKCFQNIRFEKGRTTDDTLTTPQIMNQCQIMGYFDTPLYYYLIRMGSMTRVPYNNHTIDKVLAYLDNHDLVQKYYPEAVDYLNVRLISAVYTNLMKLELTGQTDKFIDDVVFYYALLSKYKVKWEYMTLPMKINVILTKNEVIKKVYYKIFGKSLKKFLQIS